MSDSTPDLTGNLARLITSGEVESVRVEIVLKPKPPLPPPDIDYPKAIITIGPVSTKG